MRLSISVKLLGRCVTVCLPFSLWFALPTFTGSKQRGGGGAAIADPCRTWILHCYCIPTKVQMELACYCLPLVCYCLPLACYCLPLTACYCLSLAAYPLAYYYRLPACLLLSTAYPRCLQVLPLFLHTRVLLTGSPTHMACGIAFAIADMCRIRDCLDTLARHVNVYALITLTPGSIPRLSQPPLQRRLSVVTLAADSSTYCSFPVCARSWLAHML